MCCGRVGKKRDAKKTTEGWARVGFNTETLKPNFERYNVDFEYIKDNSIKALRGNLETSIIIFVERNY